MIQVIISPAKQMTVDNDAFAPHGIPPFPVRTGRVVQALRDIERDEGPRGLQRLWAVSDKLLAENVERLHDFEHIARAGQLENAAVARLVAPAIFSYVGIQYRSMAPEVLGEDALTWLQGHLWILSALYGCARPFDAVQPYRLEMGAKLSIDGARNLYAFWGNRIARAIYGMAAEEDAWKAGELAGVAPEAFTPSSADEAQGAMGVGQSVEIVNLASAEYAKAVLPHIGAQTAIATCVFSSTLRNGMPAQKSTESKTARGSMVRWMAEQRVDTIEDLKRFDVGFRYDASLSTEDGPRKTLVFMKG